MIYITSTISQFYYLGGFFRSIFYRMTEKNHEKTCTVSVSIRIYFAIFPSTNVWFLFFIFLVPIFWMRLHFGCWNRFWTFFFHHFIHFTFSISNSNLKRNQQIGIIGMLINIFAFTKIISCVFSMKRNFFLLIIHRLKQSFWNVNDFSVFLSGHGGLDRSRCYVL